MAKSLKTVSALSKLASSMALDNLEKVETVLKMHKKDKIKPFKIYETILHCYLFCGFPAVIESLKVFKKYFHKFKSEYQGYDLLKYSSAGIINCKLVYKNNFKKLIENMNYLSPEMKEWMIIEGYGKVMGRNDLSLFEREFITVSVLATKYYENQLYSHLKGCIHLGAKKSEILFVLNEIKSFTGTVNFRKSVKLLNRIHK